MTQDELFEDLKQFINAKIDGVESRLDAKIDGVESRLDAKISDLSSDIADVDAKCEAILEAIGDEVVRQGHTIKNHKIRISKLESIQKVSK